jgi:hypothetical protein
VLCLGWLDAKEQPKRALACLGRRSKCDPDYLLARLTDGGRRCFILIPFCNLRAVPGLKPDLTPLPGQAHAANSLLLSISPPPTMTAKEDKPASPVISIDST